MCFYMKTAIEESLKGIKAKDGGPFGAIIVKDNEVIASAHNEVIKTNDPTAHAEVLAIRRASAKLNRYDLSDCDLYTSCEPCPMCLAAIHWAKIRKYYYACTRYDAETIGFADKHIYDIFRSEENESKIPSEQLSRNEAFQVFEKWLKDENRMQY